MSGNMVCSCLGCGHEYAVPVNDTPALANVVLWKMLMTVCPKCGEPLCDIKAAMGQSRAGSLAESLVNVVVGYAIAISGQLLIFPAFGIHIPLQDNLLIGLLFTFISIVRSYTLRRIFNAWHVMCFHIFGRKI